MAAGGVNVLRRRDSRFSGREFDYRRSRSPAVDSRKNGFCDRTEGRVSGNQANRTEPFAKDDAGRLRPQKKRKFSPVVWDREEKEARFSSKNGVLPVISPSPPRQSSSGSIGQVIDALSDGGSVSKCSTDSESENLVRRVENFGADALVSPSKNSAVSSPVLVNVDPTQDQMEEDELFQSRNISMSRWASDIDSPQNAPADEFTPYRGGSRARVCCSNDEACYVGSGSGGRSSEKGLSDESMHSDLEQGGSGGVNLVESDFENDGEHFDFDEPSSSTHRHPCMSQSCRSVFEYEKLNKINEGTYGVVYKARDKKTEEIVALKKVKIDVKKEDGFPITSLREINILSCLRNPSIVDVKEVVMDADDGVYMVMEYMENDLKGLLEKMSHPFSIGEVKSLMLQLLEGVKYLHDNWVLHRDLKTSNLLINKDGVLKICDFGMSRQYGSPLKPYTSLVVTLWYRAPELLLGSKKYSTAIDLWSVGCIMAELVAKEPLFRGKTELDQLDKIFRILGKPNETIWPGFSELPGSKANFANQPYNLLRKKFPAASFTGSPVLSDIGLDLLSKLLTYDPEKRITAEDALNHNWFCEAPLPKSDFKLTFPILQG
ncbi:hypothetical protein UlMin_007750 [Ulmus minor]